MTAKYRPSKLVAQPSKVWRTRALLYLLCVSTLLFAPGSAFAQTGSQAAEKSQSGSSEQETARVDQLITECRQLMSRGSFDGITEKAEEALALSRKIDDKARQSRSFMYVALGRFHTGQTEEAIEPFKQAAALAGEAGDRKLQAMALRSAGTLLADSGHYEEALYFDNQVLDLQRDLKSRPGEATALRNLGRIYITTRDYSNADKALQGSLELSQALHDQLLEYAALAILSSLEIDRGDFELALKYAEQALRFESPEIDPAMKNELWHEVAIAHFKLGSLEKSAQVLEQVLDFVRKQRIASAEGMVLGSLSRVQLHLGKIDESLASSSQAVALLRRGGGDPAQVARVLYIHAQAQRALGRPQEALSDLMQAIVLLERARVLFVPTETARAQFLAGNSDIFLSAIDLLLSLGRENEALTVSESYHGRAFLDLLVESKADIRRVVPKELLDREDAILSRISGIQRELWQEGISKDREQQLGIDLAAAEERLEQFQLEVRHSNPQYASLKYLQPFKAERIQRELLDSDTALVEYVIGEEKSFAWLVSKDKVSCVVLPPQQELNRLVVDYRKAISEKSSPLAAKQSVASINLKGRQLYEILLQPFEKQLALFRKLIIVPDNSLSYLPFETLVSGPATSGRRGGADTHYLLEHFAIVYAPSASVVAEVGVTQVHAGSKGLIAFGDPVYNDSSADRGRSSAPESDTSKLSYYAERGLDLRRLPYTRTEVTNIGALFPAQQRNVFLGAEANEQKVETEKLDQYRYIHFAAHGVVDEENPARSGIILSREKNDKEDGMLQVTEIMRLKLNADLVTLSACRTGMGKVVSGEGVLGLTRAFLYAGTRSVVASLWNVNDTATSELMKAFYQNLKRGLPKDEALRKAKLELLRGKQPIWHHPYYWAPFVLVGSSN